MNKRGGGTAIYSRNRINHAEIDISDYIGNEIEATFVDYPGLQLSILCVYLPPQLNSASLKQVRESINNIMDDHLANLPSRRIIILGDFNMFDVKLLCSDLNLTDIVDKPTRGNRILDHILVSEELARVYDTSTVSIESPIGKSDHASLMVKPSNTLSDFASGRCHTVLDYRESSMAEFFRSGQQD